jgi:hypothetical protein
MLTTTAAVTLWIVATLGVASVAAYFAGDAS